MSGSRPGRPSSIGLPDWDLATGGYVLVDEADAVVAQGLRLWKRKNLDEQHRTVLYDAQGTEYVPARRLGRVRLKT